MSDAELIEKVLTLKGWQLIGERWTQHGKDSVFSSYRDWSDLLTSLDACHEVFEKDAEDGYWIMLADSFVDEKAIAMGSWTWNERMIELAKATPRQRCQAFVAFMTTSPP